MPSSFDTDWIVHSLRGRSDITAKLEELAVEGLAISFVSLAELYEGIYYSRDQIADEAGLKGFLRRVSVLGIDERGYAHLRS